MSSNKPDPVKKNLTDAEREALAKKLDEDLEDYINGLEKSASSKYMVGLKNFIRHTLVQG